MSEIYRQIREGTAPPLPEDGRCDMATNDAVDDCRGEICDACEVDPAEYRGADYGADDCAEFNKSAKGDA